MYVWIYAQKSAEIVYIEYGHDILLKVFGLGGRKGRMTNVGGFDWFMCPNFF